MSALEALTVLILISMAASGSDWLFTRKAGLFQIPQAGRLRQVFVAWSLVLTACAVLSLLHIVRSIWLVAIGAGWFMCLQGYAIYFRHTQLRLAP